MTAQRSSIIREVETDLIAARTRGYLKMPQHPHKTYSEVKAERHRRNQAYKVWAIGAAVLIGMGLAIAMVVLP